MTLRSIKPSKVKAGRDYLARINGRFRVGRFTKEWYGLLFDDGVEQSQLDGDDGTEWQGIWKLSR